jgi:hypothetical protein
VKQLKTLTEDPNKRQVLIADCVQLINDEVKSKKGISGAAVKTAFAMVKALRPRILEDSVDGLLDEFAAALQPYYEQYQESGESGRLETYLQNRSSEVAESLLGITDRRAETSSHKTLVKAYMKLRPKGKVHVEQAAPGIGRVLDKNVTSI